MYLDELTMTEFKERVKGDLAVILPIGAVEEHGSHLPLSTDTLQPVFVAEEVAKRLANCLVAPVIPYGQCSSTKNFPGTLSLRFETVRALVYDLVCEFARHGIKNVAVLSGHAGRTHILAQKLACEDALCENPDMKIMQLSDYDIAYELLGKRGWPKEDGHAGAVETSRVLAIRPDLVKMENAKDALPNFPSFRVLANPEKCFPSGVMGYPEMADAKKGKELNEYIIGRLVEEIEKMRSETESK